ncbi:hypothetical protein IMY05_011G0016500 [Salix suchowensis]|nr:hypothetical protein IMY05_011G0016500 [Salix suchowensis]
MNTAVFYTITHSHHKRFNSSVYHGKALIVESNNFLETKKEAQTAERSNSLRWHLSLFGAEIHAHRSIADIYVIRSHNDQ